MTHPFADFPVYRPRRLRRTSWMRELVAQTRLHPSDLIWPIFICEGTDCEEPIAAMPNVSRLSVDRAVIAAQKAADVGIPLIALFPNTPQALRTPDCAEAYNPNNLVNRAARAIKSAGIAIGIMTDVALDPYNSDGHDGLLRDGVVVNDATLAVLAKQAVAHAQAGADVLGPSDMMDGRVGVVRGALDAGGFTDVAIMSYSAKYASAFYGPFRDAVGSGGLLKGDKASYQLSAGNQDEGVAMAARDLREGADMVMVKPGLPYLDLCQRISSELGAATFAYQVSGEYAMIEAAGLNGWIDRDRAVLESLMAFKRAGCRGVLSYYAFEIASLVISGE